MAPASLNRKAEFITRVTQQRSPSQSTVHRPLSGLLIPASTRL
jgi:hypothetical protein